jgi:hypothetical protein
MDLRTPLLLTIWWLVLQPLFVMAEASNAQLGGDVSASLKSLRSAAEANGTVRVIVSVAPPGQAGDASQVDASKQQLMQHLRGPDVLTMEPLRGTPYVVMELTPAGIDRLGQNPAVKHIQRDDAQPPH